MKNKYPGVWRGVMYSIIAFASNAVLGLLINKGWVTMAGAIAFTTFIAHIDHQAVPEDLSV